MKEMVGRADLLDTRLTFSLFFLCFFFFLIFSFFLFFFFAEKTFQIAGELKTKNFLI